MAHTLAITGKFLGYGPVKTVGKTAFKVQSFYIDNSTSPEFMSTPEFQLTGNYIGMTDQLKRGQEITVYFSIEGRKWEKDGRSGNITTLKAYRVEEVQRTSLRAAAPAETMTAAAAGVPKPQAPAAQPANQSGLGWPSGNDTGGLPF